MQGRLSQRQREALRAVADGRFLPCLVKEEDGWHARWRAAGADDYWVDEYVRSAAMTRLSEDAECQRHPTLHDAWILALRSRTGLVAWDGAECAAFSAELEEWGGNAAPDAEARRSLAFEFEAFGGERGGFAVACAAPRGRRALRALGAAAYVCGALRGLRADPARAGWLRVGLTRGEAEDFVRSGARDLRDAGYRVEGVDLAAAVSAEADVESAPDAAEGRPAARIRLVVRVAGEPVTAEEIRFLLDQGSTLVFFRDRWIEVDRGILKEALRALEKGAAAKSNPLSFALGIGHVGRLEVEEARAHGWLRGLVNELRSRGEGVVWPVDGPEGFAGVLRGYQREGVAWLSFLTSHGFGALLADDMGLGKTVQVIAWMLSARQRGGFGGPALVVAPLTLLANWSHEFGAFAPGLSLYVHQGDRRHLVAGGFRLAAGAADVVLTSYALFVKDYPLFSGVEWSAVVVDEAQAAKNPDTRLARALRALSPRMRVALTGTPIENTVADLWSIEEFLNPGFLGERRAFAERFARPVDADGGGSAAKRLRRALEPFVLRRLKTDAGVAAELGDKREIREYCALSPAQRRDYESALEDFRAGERARGDVFALLTRLKLVCDGFDGENVEGGKLDRLLELAMQIFECGESALVFTQYAKVGAALRRALAARFGRTFPFLHGGLDAAERERIVRGFQGGGRPDLLLLSLRAGGFGLNLTKATHVVHYDRWWNPAVESQATDRAHRIGQPKTVFVHLFVAPGTVEERIDGMLRRKESLRDLMADGQAFWRAVRMDS